MSQLRIPSPARSQGAPVTPRRLQTRSTRSVGSPARSTASGRLSSIIQFKDNNKDSFFLSPLPARRSVLNDDTEIEEPRRRSWWKKLSENSRDVMEMLTDNKILETNEAVEEYIDIEVLSQEKKNYTFDLPESSDNESISSIVIPQRKLFTQKENQPQKKFAQLGGARETLAKLQKTVQHDKTVHVAPRNLFNQATKPKSKPLFPAGLLNISSNKTVNKTTEAAGTEVKGEVRTLFGNRPGTKRKNMFADFIVSESEDEISEIQPKVFGFQKRSPSHPGPSTAHNKGDASPSSSVTTDIEMEDWRLLPSSTMVENQLEDMMVKTPVKRARISMLPNIMESETTQTTNNSINKTRQSNKSKTKNKPKYFPDHILDNENQSLKSLTRNRSKLILEQAEAEEEHQEAMEEDLEVVRIKEVKVNNDGLHSEDKDSDKNVKVIGQISFRDKIQTPNVSYDTTGRRRKNDHSKVDSPKVVLLNKTKQIDSSIMIEKQLDNMMDAVSTPIKKARASKLQDTKESETIQTNNTSINKTRQSNKSATKIKSLVSLENNENNESHSHKSLTRSRSRLLLEQEEDEKEHQVDRNEAEEEIQEVASTGESEAANDVLQYEDDDSVQSDEIENELGQMSSNNKSGTPNVSINKTDQHRKKDQSKVNSPEIVLHEKTKQMESYTMVKKQCHLGMMGDVNTPINEARHNKLPNFNKSGTFHTSIINTSLNKARQSNKFAMTNNSLNFADQIENNINQSLKSLTRNRSKLFSKQNEIEEVQEVNKDSQEGEEERQELDVDDQEEKEVSQEVEKEGQEVNEESDRVEIECQESEDERQEVNEVQKESQEVDEDDHEEVEVNQEVDEDDQEEVEVSQEVDEYDQEEVDENDQVEMEVSQEVDEDDQVEMEVSQEVDEDDQEAVEESQEVEEESQEVDEDDQEELEVSQEVDEDDQEAVVKSQVVDEESQEVDEDDQKEVVVSQEVKEDSQEVDEDDKKEAEVSEEEKEDSQEVDKESDGLELDYQESKDENQEVDEQSQEVEENKLEDGSTEEMEATNEDEDSEQIEETSGQRSFNNENGTLNMSRDTTGPHRKKEQSIVNSPEVILHDKTKQMESFLAKGRNTSLRRTSIMKSMSIRPSLAPHRDSTGISDGTKKVAEGSGWDSHRTTRKTLRQTFGKDFSPRKSLRALVMEKSAKRQTAVNDITSVTSKFPQANSTELPEGSVIQDYDEVVPESDHEVSKRTRQTTLEIYLQKIKKQNMQRKMQMEEIVRNSLKEPPKDTFKVPARPMFAARKSNTKVQSKPKAKQKSTLIPLGDLPADVLEDMKYKPPKRFQPSNAAWITKRLYKFLETKLEPKYDYKARMRAEKLVSNVYQFCRELRRCEIAPPAAVQALKVDMARLNITTTHFDFYQFFHDYMPREIRVKFFHNYMPRKVWFKVVPDVVNKIPLPKHGVFSDILRENAAHD